MLKVENLVVKYGMIEAIKGISFEVNDGDHCMISHVISA